MREIPKPQQWAATRWQTEWNETVGGDKDGTDGRIPERWLLGDATSPCAPISRDARQADGMSPAERYNQLVKQHLHDNPHPQTTEEAITTLHMAITEAVTTIKPKHVHRTKGKHGTRIQADIRALGTVRRCFKRGTDIPEDLQELPVYTSIADPNAKRVGQKL